jgi:uncharacterized protein YdhG (YjbR/CyaY superfamily)
MSGESAKPQDVDSYIAHSSRDARPLLEELRALIKATVPDVEEGISWGVPFYKYHGPLAGFATYKKHVSFGLTAGDVLADHRKGLEDDGYSTGTKTIQIKFGQRVPDATIRSVLAAQAHMNEARKRSRK